MSRTRRPATDRSWANSRNSRPIGNGNNAGNLLARSERGHNLCMRPTDVPPHRSLGQDNGRDEDWRAWPRVPDGRARPPAELIDNLRLRLSELPGNHPSTPRAADRQHDLYVLPPGRGMPSDRPESRDRAERSGSIEPPDNEPPDDDAAAGQLTRSGDRTNGAAPSADRLANLGNTGGVAMMNVVDRARQAEAYRPWFMCGESAAPWWAADADLWAE